MILRGGECAIFFFARSDWTLETSPECSLIGTAEKGCIALQLITLTIASFVGISVGVVPVLMLGGVATLICAFC